MAIQIEHYAGREQAYVKHTFLDKYLPSLIGKVCSRYDEFVYIDGFAGPWKSNAGETFDDTSFGIALNHMTAIRLRYLAQGRDVRMRAILVEKDPGAFAQLTEAIKRFPKVDTFPICGEFESKVTGISALVPHNAFVFSLIDPKGFPDIEKLLPLFGFAHCELLINFMFDHANRFAETGLISRLERWLAVGGGPNWEARLKGLSGAEREAEIESLAVEGLRKIGRFTYSPVISIDKPSQDRTLYKLIYFSRHEKGLEVFRSSEAKALEVQAQVRTSLRDRKREERSGMADMFPGNADIDRSARALADGAVEGRRHLLQILDNCGTDGQNWGRLWPVILNEVSITKSRLGLIINEARKSTPLKRRIGPVSGIPSRVTHN
ncbi:three-Cys-motif partner protein TcmP [Tsuneonella troitsensis]|uniref:three-Cys-motif partner protein TcmP n=1 Tax=Tsuneonella troitsensis TaxID=292222 RepID=UPI0009FAEBC4|nr:three-Cys-motif partner protein TcmP [Tsuneonella troitsensis]